MSFYRDQNDYELVSLLKKRDDQAFTEIYERYWAVLFNHARRMLQDEEAAKDVVQDVFSTLWNKSEVLELRVSLPAYLYTLVRNRILNIISRDKVKTGYLNSLEQFIDRGETTTDHQIREKQLAERIEAELALLPPKMREIFELSRKHHLSYQEIAEQLNISEHTVKKQISNALKHLRIKLGFSFLVLVMHFYS